MVLIWIYESMKALTILDDIWLAYFLNSVSLLGRCIPGNLSRIETSLQRNIFGAVNRMDVFERVLKDFYMAYKELIVLCLIAAGAFVSSSTLLRWRRCGGGKVADACSIACLDERRFRCQLGCLNCASSEFSYRSSVNFWLQWLRSWCEVTGNEHDWGRQKRNKTNKKGKFIWNTYTEDKGLISCAICVLDPEMQGYRKSWLDLILWWIYDRSQNIFSNCNLIRELVIIFYEIEFQFYLIVVLIVFQ